VRGAGVAVFDNGSFTVYWDGALAGSISLPLGYTDVTQPTQIGSSIPSAMSEGWVGMLDEVGFYADALTPEAVQAHYQAFLAGDHEATAGRHLSAGSSADPYRQGDRPKPGLPMVRGRECPDGED